MRKIIIIFSIAVSFVHYNLQSQNTVANYSFNNDANDISPYGNDGVVNGAILTLDRLTNDNSAYHFDGTAYIDMGNDPSLDLQQGLSISAWCKRIGAEVSQTIVSRGDVADGDFWLGLVYNGADFVIEIRIDGEVFTGTTPVDTEWNYIAVTADTSPGGINIYLNGEMYWIASSTKDLVGTSSFNLRVGNNANGDIEYFNGDIDEIHIFNKALKQSEVKFLFGITPLNTEIGASSFGNALDFDGINDFIVMDPDTLSEVYNGFTIETWAKWKGDPLSPELNNVFFEILMGDSNGGNAGGAVRFTTQGFVTGSAWLNPNGFYIDNNFTQDNEWHHFAVTLDVELGIGKFYVDGIETGSIDRSTCFADGDCELINVGPDPDPTSELYGLVAKTPFDGSHFSATLFTIGKSQFYDTFLGQLDELKIWNYPRSQNEINAGKNSPAYAGADGLVYYFNFDQGIASSVNTSKNIIKDVVNNKEGELSGFSLNGSTSNWVQSNFSTSDNVPKITSVSQSSSISGQTVKIYCANILNDLNYNKVFFGITEATIETIEKGVITVVVPNEIIGYQPISILNSFGGSIPYDFTIISTLSNLAFSWENQTIYSQMAPKDLDYGDFDGDGDMDIVASSSNELLLFKNDGAGTFSDPTVVSNGADFNQLTIFDVDSDGDLDILAIEAGINLVHFSNDGLGISWNRILITTHTSIEMAIEPIDSDRDGDLDLLVYGKLPELANNYGIKLMQNDGLGNFTYDRVLASGINYYRPKGLTVDDFNGDGYFDIAVVTPNDDLSDNAVNLLIAEKNGDFTATRIGDATEYSEVLISADINNDGYADLANIGYQNPYNWWTNDGSANLTKTVNYTYNSSRSTGLESGDLDGDGFVDILVSFNFGGHNTSANVAWFKNMHATIDDFELLPISDEIFNVTDLKAVDLDNDGDLDVIATSTYDNKVTTIFHKYAVNDFESFFLIEQVEDAIIDVENHAVDVTVENDANLAKLYPFFTISERSSLNLYGEEVEPAFTPVDFSEIGNYQFFTIIAENGVAQDWVVNVHPLPGVPYLFDAFNIYQDAVDLDWTYPDFTDTYEVDISTDNFVTFESYIVDTEFLTIRDLLPGTKYKGRLRGVNDYGTSQEYSNVITFVTVPPNPQIAGVTEISADGAVIYWNASQGADLYGLDVGKDEFFSVYVGGYDDRGVSSLAESVVGLEPGTNYWAKIASENESGISDYSDVVTFLTLPESPTFDFYLSEQQSVTLFWEEVNSAIGYEIEAKHGDIIEVYPFSVGGGFGVVDGLLEATDYRFRIRAQNDAGYSEYSNQVSVMTVSGTPQNIMISDLDQKNAILSWDAVNGAESYSIELSTDNFSSWVSGYGPKIVTGNIIDVDKLTPGVNYDVRIQSQNSAGVSEYSDIHTFSTISATPIARSASAISSTSFTANWDGVSGDNVTYTLEIADNVNFETVQFTETTSGALSFQKSSLPDGVSYWYRVRSNNDAGSSPFSQIIFVEQPLLIKNLTYDKLVSQSKTGSTPITFAVTGGTNDFDVTILYKGALASTFKEQNLVVENGIYTFNVLRNMLDAVGLSFQIEINDGTKSLLSDVNAISISDIDADIPLTSIVNKWQMFSIPYVLDDDLIETIFDELGPLKYKSEWRLMHYDGVKYVDAGAGISRIELGKGYWYYSSKEIDVSFTNADVNTIDPFEIELRQGWNQVGNPYNVDISWNSVRNANNVTSIVQPVIQFDATKQEFASRDVLSPFAGGFVWSDEAVNVDVSSSNDNVGGRLESTEITNHDIEEEEWILDLNLNNNSSIEQLSSIGMHPEASELKDKYDKMVMPRFFNYLEMYTKHDDYFYPYFKEDVVPTATEHSWLFEVESNYVGGMTSLEWDNSSFTSAIKQLWLIDEQTGQIVNMNNTNHYSYNLNEKHTFSIHLTKDGITAPVPFRMNLSDPYPNPTRNVATVSMFLPEQQESYQVRLEIFDLQGHVVEKIASGEYAPGIYNFETSFGTMDKVKNGVYLYRLSLDNSGITPVYKKLILNK